MDLVEEFWDRREHFEDAGRMVGTGVVAAEVSSGLSSFDVTALAYWAGVIQYLFAIALVATLFWGLDLTLHPEKHEDSEGDEGDPPQTAS